MKMLRPGAALFAAALFAAPAAANAATQTYRFSLNLLNGESKYAVAVKPDSPGETYRVTTDALGRIVREDARRDGRTLYTVVYAYQGTSLRAQGFQYYLGAKLTDRAKIQRNAAGFRTRTSWYTMDGKLSTERIRAIHGRVVDETIKNGVGAVTGRSAITYDAAGIDVADTQYSPDGSFTKDTYDPRNGEALTSKVYVGGKLDNTSTMTYDAYGDILRKESFASDGRKFFDVTFADGLPVRRLTIGASQVVTVLHYDNQRILTSAAMSVNGKLVCRFVYERNTDGVVRRTLAYSPAHELLAEYPNAAIEEVHRDGSTIFGEPGTIYHKGDWW